MDNKPGLKIPNAFVMARQVGKREESYNQNDFKKFKIT